MSAPRCSPFRMPWCNMNVGLRDVHFKNQDIPQLRSELLLSGELFEDPCFLADQTSLGDVVVENVVWKRPKDLCANPQLFSTAPTQSGVKSGKMSSPWVVSAISVLGGMRELFYMVMPDSHMQEWRDDPSFEYLGLFYFCFWHFGTWTFVTIDDRLPTVDGELIFTQSTDKGEFWIPLLEKAYAKLHGSYQKLEYGHVTDALVDFTGGVAETYELSFNEEDVNAQLNHLMETISHELSSHSILCVKINQRHVDEDSDRNELGLTRGAVYQINGAKFISLGESKIQSIFSNRNRIGMIRLRGTPPEQLLGTASPVSQKSSGSSYAYSAPMLARLLSRNPKWAQVKESEQQSMGLTFDHFGEFWMPLDDMVAFGEVMVIHFYTKNAYALRMRWREDSTLGHWTSGAKGTSTDRAGGCPEFQDTLLRNPQYAFDIPKHEENVVIQLLQWTGADKTKLITTDQLPILIGFCIIKIEENRCYRLTQQWDFNPTVVTIQPQRKRQLYYCGTLARGRYIIIPFTYKPGELAGFMLRTFAKTKINLQELKQSGPTQHWPKFIFKYPSLTTVIVVGSLSNLAFGKGSNLWIQLKCEGKTAKTSKSQDSSQLKWSSAFVFYRANPDKAISVRLYSRKWQCFHTLLGQADLPAVVNRSLSPLEVTLRDKAGEPTSTILSLKVLTIDSILCS